MRNLVNAIELPVIETAKAQIAKIQNFEHQFSLSEVVAYACNRLPAMYVTTEASWIERENYIRGQMQSEISDVVGRAIRSFWLEDPRRDRTPIPETVLATPAQSLARLQRILNQPSLQWKEVSDIVKQATDDTNIAANTMLQSTNGSYAGLEHSRRSQLNSTMRYLARTRAKASSSETTQTPKSIQDREFDLYMSRTDLSFANTIEFPLISLAYQLVEKLSLGMKKLANPEEVAAFVLNQLPPMYASSDRDFKLLNQKAKLEIGQEILKRLQKGIFVVSQAPAYMTSPILFNRFQIEQNDAITNLKQILRRRDITWNNVPSVVQDELNCPKPMHQPRHYLKQCA